ncbi:MAG: hypothetical protein R3F49_22695 [Planctomycetota bacterium]
MADRDGTALVLELLLPAGNDPARALGLMLQESFARVGCALALSATAGTALNARVADGDFDAYVGFWNLGTGFDPRALFHSSYSAVGAQGRNYGGLADDEVDGFLDVIQRELDPELQQAAWWGLHRRLYRDLQPYLFLFQPMQRCVWDRGLGGVRTYRADPGYALREWFR